MMMMAEGSLTRHGFPRGYRFVPSQLELLSILSRYIETGDAALDPPHRSIFHDIHILSYHPEELHGPIPFFFDPPSSLPVFFF
jgi:hypothetical protein